jgi:peptidoglycan/LPS O-acetylase OafA/YrhL
MAATRLPALQTATRPRAAGGPIPSLDGIRAVSVGLVFFSHGGLETIVPGALGVTIFFVLSGFLITTLMREEYTARDSISFRAFYLRRFLRLMPPLVIVTAISVALSLTSGLGSPFTPTGLLSVLCYFSNYFRIVHGPIGLPPGLGVTWSLAIEEHYYLLYPPLALALLKFGRPQFSAISLALLCALILAWRCWLQLHGGSEDHLSMGTDTRVDAILIGCLLAMISNPWLDPVPAANRTRDLSLAGVCLGLLVATFLWRSEFFRMTFRYTLQCVAIAGLLYLAVTRAQMVPFRWLNTRPLVYLGAVSYTVYLSHYLVLVWAQAHVSAFGRLAVVAVTAIVTLGIASLMREWIEKPCAALRRRLHHGVVARTRSSASAIPEGPR